MDMKFLRKWHRWISWIAAIFLLWAAATGVLVAFTEFFGADEAERERLRDTESPVKLVATDWQPGAALQLALATAQAQAPGAPVDRIELKLKGDPAVVDVFLGKPGGGEDKMLHIDATTGALISVEAYADKPFLYRLHSGEAFGDGGLVGSMLWGLALVILALSGGLMYLHMYRKHQVAQQPKGWRKFIW
jgi:uncharacterized iron-regulated membrane protein